MKVPEVVIDSSPEDDLYCKFIVAQLADGNGGSRLVVRASRRYEYHSEILAALRRKLKPRGLKARCIGGGIIKIDHKAKAISIWADSATYGREPDRQRTVQMLQAAFPEFQVSGE
ncbi:MAG: hypothetical protein M1334_01140 [Patescibacteria group bacterium]|nr:hypothetical protein [Patescibacteria group bacterium]